jgi:hypothetical protein
MVMQTSIYAVVLTLLAICGSVCAQTLTISRSPSSPSAEYRQSGAAFDYALVAFRFEATGGDVDLQGFGLAPAGATFMAGVAALACWLDDGDGAFDAQVDAPLWSGAPVLPLTAASFAAVTVPDGGHRDIWIVASFTADAGSSLGNPYSVAFGPATSVSADGAVVAVSVPALQSAVVTLVLFGAVNYAFFNGVFHLEGSGLTPPLALTIEGQTRHYPAPSGLPQANGGFGFGYFRPQYGYFLAADYTSVWFIVGSDNGWPYWPDFTPLSVQLTTASAGLQDLGYREYQNYYVAYGGDGTGSGTGGCALGGRTTALWPLLAGLTLLWRMKGSRPRFLRRNKAGTRHW